MQTLQKYFYRGTVLLALLFGALCFVRPAQANMWVTAYYPGWQQNRLKPSDIDFSAITHLIHFAVWPRQDGSLDTTHFLLSEQHSSAIISAAHNAGVKVLLCVGGASSAQQFRGAIDNQHRAQFISNLVTMVTSRGYDGLDIDMEPINDADIAPYSTFIQELRTALKTANSQLLLTAAAAKGDPAIFFPLRNEFDQINIMTYDQSGPWPGFETWHNAALYNIKDGGVLFQHPWMRNKYGTLPSTQKIMLSWLSTGFAIDRLGVGIPFYGTKWELDPNKVKNSPTITFPNVTNGVFEPNQSITNNSADEDGTVIVKTQILSYDDIMTNYFTDARSRWDARVNVPYLSEDSPGRDHDFFISYDNAASIGMKVQYARSNNLGGVMIWELGSDSQGELLQAVKDNAFN